MKIVKYFLFSLLVSSFFVANILYFVKVISPQFKNDFPTSQINGYYGFFFGQLLMGFRFMFSACISKHNFVTMLPFIYYIMFGLLMILYYNVKIDNGNQFIITMNCAYVLEWFVCVSFIIYILCKPVKKVRQIEQDVPLLDTVVVDESSKSIPVHKLKLQNIPINYYQEQQITYAQDNKF
jgi:hypothetical protein